MVGQLLKIIRRICAHALYERRVFAIFNDYFNDQLKDIIQRSESGHHGEIKVIIEGGLDLSQILRGITPEERARELFSRERIWDTEHNSGILIYILYADRSVAIQVDRGITKIIPQSDLSSCTDRIAQHFAKGDYLRGLDLVCNEIGEKLRESVLREGWESSTNEVSDDVRVIR